MVSDSCVPLIVPEIWNFIALNCEIRAMYWGVLSVVVPPDVPVVKEVVEVQVKVDWPLVELA
jgi:hypothetical protein